MNTKATFVLLLGLSGLTWAVSAHANCDETAASQSDNDLWNIHGCWSDFFNWHYSAFETTSDDWGGRGFNDACNPNKEYPKHWSAAYLMSYGLADDNEHSFHSGQRDYLELGRARSSSQWHAEFRHQASDDTSFFGQWIERTFKVNLVQTSCLLYNFTLPNAGPGSRGGDFAHEGTHAWMDRHGFKPDHFAKAGTCTLTGNACDYFYFHPVSEYQFGELWIQNGTASRFHSPNQTQVEYLCDVSDFPAAWVPSSVRIQAAQDANTRATSRFINGPGYSCGTVRPW
jgi:hypothetical protein